MAIETGSVESAPADERAHPDSGSNGTAALLAGRRRRYQTFTRRDRMWLALMVGIPATLHIVLVWIPALLTAVLSFTEWDNLLPISEVSPVGFRNYWQIFTIFDNRLFPAMFNNLMLIAWLFLCSAIGILFAYLLDKNIRGSRVYQSIYFYPVVLSLAVVGFIWKSRDVRARPRVC